MRTAAVCSAWFVVLVAVPSAHSAETAETAATTKAAAKPIDANHLPSIEKVSGPGLEVGSLEDRPQVAGDLRLHLRSRHETTPGSKEWKAIERSVDWKTCETAIIICDMWNDHFCVSAAQRVGIMAPRMNRVLTAARAAGVLIIHAPSGVMEAYADTAQRKRMQTASPVKPPVPIEKWCLLDTQHEPEMPVDTSKCSCDDPSPRPAVRFFSRQHPAIDIMGYDGISDRGDEIYDYLRKLGIKNVALMGMHTNMCVLGRPFGIRQQVRLGMNTVLVRDLTDAMYDPRQPPHVSHARGTELVVEHIEKYWCPSIVSDDLTTVVAGTAGP